MDCSKILIEYLNEGIFGDNLRKMGALCSEAEADHDPLVYFTLRTIFYTMAEPWEDQGIPTSAYNFCEETLYQPFLQLFEGMGGGASDAEKYALLSDVVIAYTRCRAVMFG